MIRLFHGEFKYNIPYEIRYISAYTFYEFELLNFFLMSLAFYLLADFDHVSKE